MKSNLLNCMMVVCIFLHLLLPVSLWAVEIAPRISDREIIEKPAILEGGQKALRAEMKLGQEAIHWDWEKHYPVIHISFGSGAIQSREALDQKIRDILYKNETNLAITCRQPNDIPGYFGELIRNCAKKYHLCRCFLY